MVIKRYTRDIIVQVNLAKLTIAILAIKVILSSSILLPWKSFVDDLFIVFAIVLLGIKMSKEVFEIKAFLFILIFSFFLLFSCLKIEQYDLLITFIAILLLKDENLEECVEVVFVIQSIVLGMHFVISILLSEIGYEYTFWSMVDGRHRFNMGFLHPNVVSLYLLSCMMMYIWLKYKSLELKRITLLFGLIILFYYFTKSRTSFFLSLILLVFVVAIKNNIKQYKIIRIIIGLLFPLFSICIYFLQIGYLNKNEYVILMDKFLSGRIKLAAYAYSRSGITFLPRKLDYIENGIVEWNPVWKLNYFTFDNIYSFLLVQLGIIWIIIISYLIFRIVFIINYQNLIFILIWILLSMTEVHGLNCFEFFPSMFLSIILNSRGGKVDNDTFD